MFLLVLTLLAAGVKCYIPSVIKASNVQVICDNTAWSIIGIKAFNLHKGLVYSRNQSENHLNYNTNARITFENISQSNRPYFRERDGGLVNIVLPPNTADNHYLTSNDAWKPYIYIHNCTQAAIYFTAKGYIKASNSTIISVDVYSTSQYSASEKFVHLDNCAIQPTLLDPVSVSHNIAGATLISNSTWQKAKDHSGATVVYNVGSNQGFGNTLTNGTTVTDFSNIKDGFFVNPAGAIVDASAATTTTTLNSLLNTLRDKGIISR
jgi:hypothetical protein